VIVLGDHSFSLMPLTWRSSPDPPPLLGNEAHIELWLLQITPRHSDIWTRPYPERATAFASDTSRERRAVVIDGVNARQCCPPVHRRSGHDQRRANFPQSEVEAQLDDVGRKALIVGLGMDVRVGYGLAD